MKEEGTMVPLEEVVGEYVGDSGEVETLTWESLNELEQELVQLICGGKYGEAADLSGDGYNANYDKDKVYAFLLAVARQHDTSIEMILDNKCVVMVTGISPG